MNCVVSGNFVAFLGSYSAWAVIVCLVHTKYSVHSNTACWRSHERQQGQDSTPKATLPQGFYFGENICMRNLSVYTSEPLGQTLQTHPGLVVQWVARKTLCSLIRNFISSVLGYGIGVNNLKVAQKSIYSKCPGEMAQSEGTCCTSIRIPVCSSAYT